MSTEDLHIGDKVWQKSGGPEMTIVDVKTLMAKPDTTVMGSAKCKWVSEGENQEGQFAIADLTKTEPLKLKTELARFKSNAIYQQRSTLGELYDWLRPAWDQCEELHRYYAKDAKDRMNYQLEEYLKLTPILGDDLLDNRCREIEVPLGCVCRLIQEYGREKLVSEVMNETGE